MGFPGKSIDELVLEEPEMNGNDDEESEEKGLHFKLVKSIENIFEANF